MSKTLMTALAALAMTATADTWPDRLWLGRGGFWTERVGFAVTNPSEGPVEGRPVSIRVGADKDELPLAGVRIEELRLVDARGVELLYGVWVPGETVQLEKGPIPAGAEITIPLCAAAKATANYFFYFGNPSAWALADRLKGRGVTDLNGGFEAGVKRTPSGWMRYAEDDTHQLTWDEKTVATGKRSIGAQATGEKSWFSFSRSDITVRPGANVTLRVKVKGRNVKGSAGWYVHIGNEKNAMVVNRTVSAGTGTFDWKPVEIRVKVPDGCTHLATGSTLYGQGAAWYDDFAFETDRPEPKPEVSVGSVEKLAVTKLGEDDPWTKTGEWAFRVPIRIANFSDEAIESSFAAFSLRDAVRGARNPDWRVEADGQAVDCCALGTQVLFPCKVPARTIRTCWMYVKDGEAKAAAEKPEEVRSALGSVIPSDQVLVTKTRISDEAAYRRLVDSPANLVKNPRFTAGEASWTHTGERKGSPVRYEVVPTGGKLGGGFAKTVIPPTAKLQWRGWYQTVPLKPGRSYLYGGYFSGDDVSGSATIAAHVLGKNGKATKMLSTSESISGTTPWTPSFGMCTAGGEDAKLVVHLTTCLSGSFAYDGIVVAEHLRAEAGDPQSPAETKAEGLAVQPVEPIVKVFRETAVRNCDDDFEVALARNETEPLQLAVRSPRPIRRLEVEVSAPTTFWGRGGVTVETGVVGYVPVDYATAYYSLTTPEWELKYPTHSPGSDGWSGWWPDPIRPESACALEANVTQAIWLNFKTTAETKPGTYSGTITWKADGEVVRTDDYEVKVWDFTLPAVAETPAIYDVRLGRGWNEDFKGLSADERRRKVWKFYSEKRISPDSLGGSVKFERGKDGKLTADFSAYDRLATEYFEEFKFPVSYTPHVFGCFGWGMPPRKMLGENPYEGEWPFEGVDRSKLRPAYVKAYQDALRLYWNHMKEKGWADRIVLYISDEPHFSVPAVRDQMIALCKMIHEVDPAIRIYSSTWRHCPAWNDSIDVWGVAHYGGFPVAEMKARAAAGKHIWFTTDGQMCLDTPYCAVERLLPHYCTAFHAEAYEFWGATWLTYDPWKFGWHAYIPQTDTPGKHYYVRYPDGDGYLMYPGIPGAFKGPVTSVRLEAARDGVEDFSYLQALKRLAAADGERGEQAAALLADLAALVTIPNAGGRYSTRILPVPEKVGQLRRRAGELLDGAEIPGTRP